MNSSRPRIQSVAPGRDRRQGARIRYIGTTSTRPQPEQSVRGLERPSPYNSADSADRLLRVSRPGVPGSRRDPCAPLRGGARGHLQRPAVEDTHGHAGRQSPPEVDARLRPRDARRRKSGRSTQSRFDDPQAGDGFLQRLLADGVVTDYLLRAAARRRHARSGSRSPRTPSPTGPATCCASTRWCATSASARSWTISRATCTSSCCRPRRWRRSARRFPASPTS